MYNRVIPNILRFLTTLPTLDSHEKAQKTADRLNFVLLSPRLVHLIPRRSGLRYLPIDHSGRFYPIRHSPDPTFDRRSILHRYKTVSQTPLMLLS